MRFLTRASFAASCLSLAVSLPACKSEPVAPPALAPAPPAEPVAPAPAAPASVSGQSKAECIAPFSTTGDTREFTLGKLQAKVTGTVLDVVTTDEDEKATFGLIANLKEPTGENLFNVGRYLEFFTAQGVDAILVAGDTGDAENTESSVSALLEPLAKTGLPVFVIPGSREASAGFSAALSALSAKYSNVVNMSQVRLVNFDDASIVSLPGYYDARYIAAGEEGCQYFKEDVDALAGIVKAAKAPVVLLSHAEALGEGREALDAFPDGNAGDANLAAFIKSNKVPFGVFANIHEAGGRAADLSGKLATEDVPQKSLFVNVGLGDSTPWKLNDGTWSYGLVATLKIDGDQASYKAYRAPQLTDDERTNARALEPASAAVGE